MLTALSSNVAFETAPSRPDTSKRRKDLSLGDDDAFRRTSSPKFPDGCHSCTNASPVGTKVLDDGAVVVVVVVVVVVAEVVGSDVSSTSCGAYAAPASLLAREKLAY